ncbi:serine/threonine protein kinase [Penicillium coprophilum]|uniref:serine/threonine protein kinase n=1 Tax=Penicillium coprophilum TaxID=36646 RepID=UPI00238B7969|nr:serine/threonine protein kinase [Penicillium coprophilum]KAJ5155052.1 serine/threonine protein kinase [Penicillium coprophilum]
MDLALSPIHGHSVVVADVACRNILLDSDLSIHFGDFTESSIMPPETIMGTDDDNGYSIPSDIGQLGKVIREVIAEEKISYRKGPGCQVFVGMPTNSWKS